MAYLNNFASRFRKGIASANPFTALGRVYCASCRMDVDHETESAHRGSIYVYRRRCKRCGGVLARGVYDNVPLLQSAPSPARVEADGWTQAPGEDRR